MTSISKPKFEMNLIAVVLTVVALLYPFDSAQAACSTPTANVGSIDFQSGVFKFCDGTNWQILGATTDASLLTSGTIADGRLSSNIPLKNAANTFSVGGQQITNTVVGTIPFTIRAAAGQTATLTEWEDNTGALIYGLAPDGVPTAATDLADKGYVDTSVGNYVLKAGDTMTGALEGTSGTLGAPGFTFSGDTDTGIHRSAADNVSIVGGGVDMLHLNATTNIHDLYGAQLNVNWPYGSSTVRTNATDAAGTGNFVAASGSGAGLKIGTMAVSPTEMKVGTTSDNSSIPLYLQTNSQTQMTILTGGSVGIGTTAPATKLHVTAGDLRLDYGRSIQWNASNNYISVDTDNGMTISSYQAGQAQQGPIMFKDSNSGVERMRISNIGNLGVGRTTPLEKVDVNGGVRLGNTTGANAGTLRWTGVNFQAYDGTTWFNIVPNPTGTVGCDSTQTYNATGIHTYVVPASYATITIKLWGAGGGGGGINASGGTDGQSSTVSSLGLSAGGGFHGVGGGPGSGGTASGGTTNVNGNAGTAPAGGSNPVGASGAGGSAPTGGGAGGASLPAGWYVLDGNIGNDAGGGGGGGYHGWSGTAAGGGSGSYVEKTFTPATLPTNTTINDIYVGAGGLGEAGTNAFVKGGNGGPGRISVTCSTTGTPASLGWGSCSIASFAATSGANSKTCTGVVAGSPIYCSPAAAPGTATVTWGARASAANTVDINLSANFTTSTTWKCMFMNP